MATGIMNIFKKSHPKLPIFYYIFPSESIKMGENTETIRGKVTFSLHKTRKSAPNIMTSKSRHLISECVLVASVFLSG